MKFFKMAVAIDQHHGFKPFNRSQRCRLQSFTHLDYNIQEFSQTNLTHSFKQAFEAANIHRSFSTPCFSLATRYEDEFDVNPRVEIVGGHGAPRVHALVVEVAIAMAFGVDPLPVSSGLGGAYFLRNRYGDKIAVAKPIDEDSKGFGGLMLGQPGRKRSVQVGGTGIRELAAYLLDHGGFASVPPTVLVKITHAGFPFNDGASPAHYKIASLQQFVDHDFDAGELGPSGFLVASVHRIGILDVRLLNLDRHAGNILVKKNDKHENYAVGAAKLVPIDHGLCLPEFLDNPYFEWLHWPQASVPFSETELDYISKLDPSNDADLLRTELPSLRESSIRGLVVCTIFLKRAAAAGLCLADIGEMMTRESCGGEENMSLLENVCAKAKASVGSIEDDDGDEDDSDGSKNNEQSIDLKEEVAIFELDDGNENDSSEVLDVPQLSQCLPDMDNQSKMARFTSARSMPRLHNDSDNGDDGDQKYHEENADESRGGGSGGLTRSISCSIQNYNVESEGISLGGMSEAEWELFLECFEKLLLEAFQGTNCVAPKLRLGTSCQF